MCGKPKWEIKSAASQPPNSMVCFWLIYRGMWPLFVMIVSLWWSCPVVNLANEFWEVRTVETYVKSISCSNFPIPDSNWTILFICPPPPFDRNCGLTSLIFYNLFTRNSISLDSQARNVTANHLNTEIFRNCCPAMLFWRSITINHVNAENNRNCFPAVLV